MSKTTMVLLRIVGSVVGLLACGIAVGGAIFLFLLSRVPDYDDNPDETTAFIIILSILGFFVGAFIGAPVGATIMQKILKQRGSFWRALLCTLVGLVVGGFLSFPLGLVFSHLGEPYLQPIGAAIYMPLIVCAFMVVGAVIGSGWKSKPAEAASPSPELGASFERRGDDVYCKRCGFELIGPGGPCRKCDNVKTRSCSSCGRYILASDRTCPYCVANLK
jgi:hypothetical protein